MEIELAGENLALPKMGSKLAVSLGYKESGLVDMGVYVINAITMKRPPHTVQIKGHGADLGSHMKIKRTRMWRRTTVGEIVGDIGSEHGYKPAVSKDLADVKIPHIDQTDESDLHFFTRIAHAHSATTKPAGEHLLFVPKNSGLSATGKMLETIHLKPSDITTYEYTQNKRNNDDTLSLTMPGRHELKAEMPIVLDQFDPSFPFKWIIGRSTHTLNSGRFSTAITAQKLSA